MILGSDGSTHLQRRVATCAWLLHQDDGRVLKACYLLGNMTSLSSYRSELEGLYRSLLQLQQSGLTPAIAQQWCDNKAAVDKSNREVYSPRDMLVPDADILLAIRHTRTQLEDTTQVVCQHIYGHQDTKTRRPPSPPTGQEGKDSTVVAQCSTDTPKTRWTDIQGGKTKPRLGLPVQINIECDRLATQTSETVMTQRDVKHVPPTIDLPYAGSRALLNIGGKWITTSHKRHILNARWESKVWEYCYKKYGWEADIFDTVDWRTIRAMRSNMTPTQQM